MKIIFLDIDGVLNSGDYNYRRLGKSNWPSPKTEDDFDPLAIERLAKIVEISKAKIVISSSWRIIYSLTEIRQAINLATEGRFPHVVDAIIDSTVKRVPMEVLPTEHQGHYQRGHEIAYWLTGGSADPRAIAVVRHEAVDGYVILDDSDDMAWLTDHYVGTTWTHGLLDEHIDKALGVLLMPMGKVWP